MLLKSEGGAKRRVETAKAAHVSRKCFGALIAFDWVISSRELP